MDVEEEVVEGVPVPPRRSARILARAVSVAHEPALRAAGSSAVVQAAAAAAGGFVTGAAVLGIVQHRQRRAAALSQPQRIPRLLARRGAAGGSGPVGELLQIVGTRSLLVDVHLLGGPSPQP